MHLEMRFMVDFLFFFLENFQIASNALLPTPFFIYQRGYLICLTKSFAIAGTLD